MTSFDAARLTPEDWVRADLFENSRGLQEYSRVFGDEFDRDLRDLGLDDTWADMGAGVGRSIVEYRLGHDLLSPAEPGLGVFAKLERDRRSKVIGVSHEPVALADKAKTGDSAIQTYSGGFFDRWAELPELKLISDYYGFVAYSKNPAEEIGNYLRRLKPGGKAYIYAGDFNEVFASKVILADGRIVSLPELFTTIKGVNARIAPATRERGATLILTRTQDSLTLPDLAPVGRLSTHSITGIQGSILVDKALPQDIRDRVGKVWTFEMSRAVPNSARFRTKYLLPDPEGGRAALVAHHFNNIQVRLDLSNVRFVESSGTGFICNECDFRNSDFGAFVFKIGQYRLSSFRSSRFQGADLSRIVAPEGAADFTHALFDANTRFPGVGKETGSGSLRSVMIEGYRRKMNFDPGRPWTEEEFLTAVDAMKEARYFYGFYRVPCG